LIITDALAQPLKVQSLAIEPGQSVYSVRLNPPDARSLGLREGQIINTVSEYRPEGNGLRLSENAFLRVNITPAIPLGTPVEVRMISLSQGILSILAKQAKGSEDPVASSSMKLDRLMSRSSDPKSLEFFLRSTLSSSMMDSSPNSLLAFALDRKWFQDFNYRSIFSSLMASGLFHEKQIMQRSNLSNLKEILLRMLRGQNLDAAETLMIGGAIEDIESNQLESLGNQIARGTYYQWLIPVLGDWPVRVQITQEEPEAGEERAQSEYLWKVELEIKVDDESSVDVSLLVTQSADLDVFVLVPSKYLYEIAAMRQEWLGKALSDAGLKAREIKLYQKYQMTHGSNPYRTEPTINVKDRVEFNA